MPFWVVSVTSIVVLAGLAVYLWLRRPATPIWPAIFHCQMYALMWVTGDLWASHATTLASKNSALTLLMGGSIPMAAAWWLTMRRYVASHGLGRPWMSSPWANLPSYVAAVAWIFAATNPWHGQLMTPVVGGPNVYHWGITVIAFWNYALVAATFALCAWATWSHVSPDTRRQMALLTLTTLIPVATHLVHVYVAGVPREDTVALGLGLGSALVIYGIRRQRLFLPLPITIPEILRRDPAGVLILDQGGRLVQWNPAAERLLEGITLELDLRVLRPLAWKLERADNGERVRSSRALTWLLTDSSGDDRHEFRYHGSRGTRWVALTLAPLPSRRGKLVAACVRIDDVTRLKTAERERQELAGRVQRSERLESLGLMAGGIAHDFNNLLTTIGGHARLALQDLPRGAREREHLDEIFEATRFAAELTHQLLSYSGRAPAQLRGIAFSELVGVTAWLLESSIEPGITVRTDLAAGLPSILGDATQLRRVVMNLGTNAIEAIGDDEGFITIRASAVRLDAAAVRREHLSDRLFPGEYILLEVTDSGCGMSAETRERVFDPFFTTKAQGRGLGLASAFGIVRAHGGAIAVESAIGRGTHFRVWLPACEGLPEESDTEPRSLDLESGWTGSGTILVADDQGRIRRVARAILERAGFDVLTAENGRDAIETLRSHPETVRLVLLDLTMPEMGGEAALKEISELCPGMPVLLTSGFHESDAMGRLASGKAAGFVQKPYWPEDLIEKVRRALGPPNA